jgi:hypothetical protein
MREARRALGKRCAGIWACCASWLSHSVVSHRSRPSPIDETFRALGIVFLVVNVVRYHCPVFEERQQLTLEPPGQPAGARPPQRDRPRSASTDAAFHSRCGSRPTVEATAPRVAPATQHRCNC